MQPDAGIVDGSGDLLLQEPFYAPSTEGALDHLFSLRDGVKGRIESIANFMDGEARNALRYCIEGAKHERERYGLDLDELLDVDRAVAALDADFWNRAMDLTDVRECMPQARRTDWYELIRGHKTPPFIPENVIPTFEDLLSSRAKFFAERVDGIFRALSRSHVTNQPEGFSKRMILQYVLSEFGGYADHTRTGYIHDLRCVIAKFMGRDEPEISASSHAVNFAATDPGQWISIDGGALRLRVYRGARTGHLEVHPDMAWRLNGVLASLYPKAIPSQFREPPKRKVRDFKLMQKPLPFQVLRALQGLEGVRTWRRDRFDRMEAAGWEPNAMQFRYDKGADKATRRQAESVIAAVGGVRDSDVWRFDYEPKPIIDAIVCSGCIPDAQSHQFYPTPEDIAREAVEAAQIGPHDECLEPSAGLGGIACLLPTGRTQCVEVSKLHCDVLRAKGFDVTEADFLKWNPPGVKFDRVVMNPPYSEGRWRAHVEHAASMVAPGGRLVAILPESARGKRLLPGWSESWGTVHAFPGTSIKVSVLTAIKAAVAVKAAA